MKRFLAIILTLIVLVLPGITSYAAADYGDDFTNLSDEIVSTINDLFGAKLDKKITSKDINFDAAFKIYVGENIFKMDTNDINELSKSFGSDGYIYELPIYINEDTIIFNIAKGQPLNEQAEFTEEERQKVLSNVGKWQVTGAKHYSNEVVNYITEIQQLLGEVPEGTILVGGLPCFRDAVALVPDENQDVQILIPLNKTPGIETISKLRFDSSNSYNYKEVKEYINKLPEPNSDEIGSDYGFPNVVKENSSRLLSPFIYIVFAVIAGAVVLGIVLNKCRR